MRAALLLLSCALAGGIQAAGITDSFGTFANGTSTTGAVGTYHLGTAGTTPGQYGQPGPLLPATLGTFNIGQGALTYFLTGGQANTQGDGNYNFTTPATLFYRVYPSGATNLSIYAYSAITLTGTGGTAASAFAAAGQTRNLLQGVVNGTYVFDAYVNAPYTLAGFPGSFDSNSAGASTGPHYTASIVVVPEPSTYAAGALLAGTVLWNFRGRLRRTAPAA